MSLDVRAVLRRAPISPFKVRRILNVIRGKGAVEALHMLRFMPHRGARMVEKLLKSAIANAEENFGMHRDDLYIYRIYADEGPRYKRYRFGARGRVKPYRRRTSHITIILRERGWEEGEE